MKIQPAKLPTINENFAKWEPSSQEARAEGWTNSDAPCVLDAVKLERRMKNSPGAPASKTERATQERQASTSLKTFKHICHRAALTCCASILPSFAFVAFGPLGLLAPAALLLAGIFLFLAAGRFTEQINNEIATRHNEIKNFDFRGSV
jgi:hypothetical protein